MNTKLIAAIARFEAALSADSGDIKAAEEALRAALLRGMPENHEAVCVRNARGCTEGLSYRGTVYAPGFDDDGHPTVVVMRRVSEVVRR